MKIIDRISQFIEYKGLSDNAFDKSIGMGNGYIGKLKKASGSVGGDVIEKIADIYTELNLIWLITGKEEMINKKVKNYEIDGKSPQILEEDYTNYNKNELVEKLRLANYQINFLEKLLLKMKKE